MSTLPRVRSGCTALTIQTSSFSLNLRNFKFLKKAFARLLCSLQAYNYMTAAATFVACFF